jgi:hypothetical protein
MVDTKLGENVPDVDMLPNGAAWAALLAASIGAAGFGLLTVLSESSHAASKILQWYPPAGSLSGVAICAILIWAAAWVVLHVRWKRQTIQNASMLMAISFAMVLLALLATFPPFYELL